MEEHLAVAGQTLHRVRPVRGVDPDEQSGHPHHVGAGGDRFDCGQPDAGPSTVSGASPLAAWSHNSSSKCRNPDVASSTRPRSPANPRMKGACAISRVVSSGRCLCSAEWAATSIALRAAPSCTAAAASDTIAMVVVALASIPGRVTARSGHLKVRQGGTSTWSPRLTWWLAVARSPSVSQVGSIAAARAGCSTMRVSGDPPGRP